MNPVIDSIVQSPSPVTPGGSFTMTIAAHDPDEKSVIFMGTVRDSQGNESQASAVVKVSDPISFYGLSAPVGSGFQVVQRAGSPNVFDCVAP